MNEKITLVGGLAFLIVGLLIGLSFSGSGNGAVPSPGNGVVNEPVAQLGSAEIRDTDHIRGNPGANIFLVEYSDLECGFCARFHPTALKAVSDNPDVAWVYRHLPIESIHPNARHASIVSECVAKHIGEEEFWEFTDRIFVSGRLNTELINSVGIGLGLTQSQIDNCEINLEIKNTIESHLSQASLLDINGTPGGFVLNATTGNVRKIGGAISYGALIDLINAVR